MLAVEYRDQMSYAVVWCSSALLIHCKIMPMMGRRPFEQVGDLPKEDMPAKALAENTVGSGIWYRLT